MLKNIYYCPWERIGTKYGSPALIKIRWFKMHINSEKHSKVPVTTQTITKVSMRICTYNKNYIQLWTLYSKFGCNLPMQFYSIFFFKNWICISFFFSLSLLRLKMDVDLEHFAQIFKFSWSRILCVRNWWNWPDQFNFTIIPSRKRNHYNKITIPPLQKMVCAKLGWILLSIPLKICGPFWGKSEFSSDNNDLYQVWFLDEFEKLLL